MLGAVATGVHAAEGIAGAAAPVGDALQRPALMVRQPSGVVLLAAAQAGSRLIAVGERGVIAVSDDGAGTWHQARVPVSVTLTMVRFADERHGVAVGHGGTVLTTEDAGDHWTLRLDGRRVAELALQAAKASDDAARIKDAEQLVADGPDKPFTDVLLFDPRRILVVGAYGLAFYSEDGGANWQPWMNRIDNPRGRHLYALRRSGSALLIAGEQGLLLRSDDGGGSFRRLESPYSGSFFTAEMPSPNEIIVAGLRGNVWRSSDAGANWSKLDTPAPASITASTLRSDGTLLLANQAGMVLSGRETLAPLPLKPLPPLNGLLARQDGSLLVLSPLGAALQPAGGAAAFPGVSQ
ncbi:WD40/YVTN/BNR-like repeat-containing protein [Variovorax sp. HW608]|uniref:WD40/YVTN/BNR-like repeat-containing protein n=1 Tax=Variovorax sp. HW608 TaxID=1034889 RepID=UPI001E36FD8D|nr:YCF48-related protein [Variovorax sp. HW608]